MIISRTPLRVSLFGGGTDLPNFLDFHEMGLVISFTINKYLYVSVNKKFDKKIKINYQNVEIVDEVQQIQHSIVRECLKRLKIKDSIEITIVSDLPGGTGLGSSSSLAVGLLNALNRFKGTIASPEELAKQACSIELDALAKPIGKQDQYAAAFGGLNAIEFKKSGIRVLPIKISEILEKQILDSSLLVFTGISREADLILGEVSEMKSHTISSLKEQKNIADEVFSLLKNSPDFITPEYLSSQLNRAWEVKRKYSNNISNETIEGILNRLENNGANSKKLLGAGGGGFILTMFNDTESLKKITEEFQSVRFEFDKIGSVIIYE